MPLDRLIAASLCGFAKLLTGVRALWLGSEPLARTRVYFANHRSHGDFVLIWASLPPALRQRTRPVAGATTARMLQEWAKFCDTPVFSSAEVVPLQGKSAA